jgi:GT2 family glycosyltransferase
MGSVASLFLITWNSAPFLQRCLAGIAQQTHRDLELIHIDNGSSDDCAAIVRAAFPDARQILNSDNRGFAAAVNQGIAASKGDHIVLCNPDAFLAGDYVERVIAELEAAGDDFGMATGKLMRAAGREIAPTDCVDSKGIRMTRTGRHFDIGQGLRDGADDRGIRVVAQSRGREGAAVSTARPRDPETPRLHEVFGVSGAAAVYSRCFIDDVSIDGEFLDEDFFSYREDADVAWRGRLLGWRALYVPDAVGWHVRTVTPRARRGLSPGVNRDSVKNRFLLRLKNEGLYLALRNAPFEIPRDLVTIAAIFTIERTSLPALQWLWKNRRRIMQKRRAIQRRRRVSDRALAGWFR